MATKKNSDNGDDLFDLFSDAAEKSAKGGAKSTKKSTSAKGSSKSKSSSNSNKSASGRGNKATTKRSKSSSEQADDLSNFATAVFTQAKSASKKVTRGKGKRAKRVINSLIAIAVVIVMACGGLYYFDIAPFDFVFADNDSFKFYSYEDYDYKPSETPVTVTYSEGELQIHYIDVGQGDSIFIQFPDGKTMLIDGAKNSNAIASHIVDYICNLYPDQDKVTIDYVMLTHCDSDHSGSLDNVIASDRIDAVEVHQPRVLSAYENDPLKALVASFTAEGKNVPTITTGVYNSFVEAVYKEQQAGICQKIVYNEQGQSIGGDGWVIYIYNPSDSMYNGLKTAQDKNNISPIMVLHFNEVEVLLTGDSDDGAERNFLANVQANMFGDGFDGDVEVLKVAHHGGQESTSDDFLSVVKPEYAIISVGEGNSYNHPRQITLDRLAVYTSNVYRTDLVGHIVMTVSGNEITFKADQPITVAQIFAFDGVYASAMRLNGAGNLFIN